MKVIVIAPHADDETLGCGGTLLKHREQGDEIYWVIITTPTKEFGYSKEQLEKRGEEIKAVSQAYGFSEVVEFNLPVTKIDLLYTRDLVLKIREAFEKIKPEIVYIPFSHDAHSDHRKTFSAALNCIKTFRFPYIKKIFMMEIISETEFAAPNDAAFAPNYFVDITNYIDKKTAIMKLYESEVDKRPAPRSLENIEALATFRGSTANCQYAESFMLLKEIW